jgi:hypothetical protein
MYENSKQIRTRIRAANQNENQNANQSRDRKVATVGERSDTYARQPNSPQVSLRSLAAELRPSGRGSDSIRNLPVAALILENNINL